LPGPLGGFSPTKALATPYQGPVKALQKQMMMLKKCNAFYRLVILMLKQVQYWAQGEVCCSFMFFDQNRETEKPGGVK